MKKLLTKVHWLCAVLLAVTLLQPGLSVAQKGGGGKFTLSGTVKGDGQPLVGATVVEPGTSNGTVTGADGKFSLSLSKRGASIQISFIGYVTKTLTANADFLEVSLDSDAQKIDEVMVVAYGTMRKRDVTGAITSISSESIERRAPSNVFEALQGQVAGVQISAGSGQPGEASQINIRGISTFSAEGVKPLYVVDGIPMEDIDGINPGDITSIEILKDAASAAMYGSRSANGVILITTKGGQEGAPRIDVKYLHTWGKLSHKLAQATRADRRKFDILRDTYHKDNATGYVDNASNQLINDSLNAAFNVDNDYQDLLFQWAQKDQVDLSVAGGTKKMKYFGSTGYYNERGIVPNTNFQRLTARINADYTANNWLTLHSRVSLGYSQKNGINEGQLMTAMLSRRPYFNLYYPDGTLAGVFQGQKSPLAQVKYTTDRTEYYQGNLYQGFELKLAKGLTFQTSINANLYLNKRQRVYPSMITDEWQKSNSGYAADNLNWNWLNENVLTYKNKWGNHNFSALVGFSEQQWRTDQTVLSGINSSTDFIPTMNAFAANLTLSDTGTWQSNHSMASLFARVTYDFKSKYLIQATFRRDGSSRFSKENRWGNFPSVSAAWRLSDENFMNFSRRALDDAKIRISWGITGNEQIGNYDYLYSYATGDIYDGVGGVYPARLAVDNLRWEETRQVDVGLDLSFFNSRLTITADYYDKYTDGLLANRELPKESGFSTMRTNVGEVSNRGFEFTIAGDLIRTKDFRWNASFNISRNWNTIEKLAEGEPYLENDFWWIAEGGSIGDFYGYKQNNIFAYDEFERLHARHVAAAHAGLRKRLVQPLHAQRTGLQRQLCAEETAQRQALPRRRRQLGGGRRFARRRDRRERPHDHRQRTADLYRRSEHELHLQEFRSLRVVLLLVRRTDLQLRRAPAQHVQIHLDDPFAPRNQQHVDTPGRPGALPAPLQRRVQQCALRQLVLRRGRRLHPPVERASVLRPAGALAQSAAHQSAASLHLRQQPDDVDLLQRLRPRILVVESAANRPRYLPLPHETRIRRRYKR